MNKTTLYLPTSTQDRLRDLAKETDTNRESALDFSARFERHSRTVDPE